MQNVRGTTNIIMLFLKRPLSWLSLTFFPTSITIETQFAHIFVDHQVYKKVRLLIWVVEYYYYYYYEFLKGN